MKISVEKNSINGSAKKILENVNDLEDYFKELENIIGNTNTNLEGFDSLKYK